MNKYEEKSLFGFWLYILSDCMLFAGLFATFAVLRGQTYGGITNAGLLNLGFLFAETLILLASSYAMGLALVFNERIKTLYSLAASLILGLTFLSFEVYEFHGLVATGNGPSRSAFLSSFFTLVGTHGLHVFLGSLWMMVTMYFIYKRGLTAGNARKLRMLALFWHFLDLIWIFIFSIVYLFTAAL
jgi:cytochrome o ubiquinol oxidase subunit III